MSRRGNTSDMRDLIVRISVTKPNSPMEVALENLKSIHLSTLVLCKTKVVKKHHPIMRLEIATFECVGCGTKIEMLQTSIRVKKPSSCPNSRCYSKDGSDFRLVSAESYFYDYQVITVQQAEKKMKVVMTHDLVDLAEIGDTIEILGIYTTEYEHSETVKKDSFYRGIIEANNIKVLPSKL